MNCAISIMDAMIPVSNINFFVFKVVNLDKILAHFDVVISCVLLDVTTKLMVRNTQIKVKIIAP